MEQEKVKNFYRFIDFLMSRANYKLADEVIEAFINKPIFDDVLIWAWEDSPKRFFEALEIKEPVKVSEVMEKVVYFIKDIDPMKVQTPPIQTANEALEAMESLFISFSIIKIIQETARWGLPFKTYIDDGSVGNFVRLNIYPADYKMKLRAKVLSYTIAESQRIDAKEFFDFFDSFLKGDEEKLTNHFGIKFYKPAGVKNFRIGLTIILKQIDSYFRYRPIDAKKTFLEEVEKMQKEFEKDYNISFVPFAVKKVRKVNPFTQRKEPYFFYEITPLIKNNSTEKNKENQEKEEEMEIIPIRNFKELENFVKSHFNVEIEEIYQVFRKGLVPKKDLVKSYLASLNQEDKLHLKAKHLVVEADNGVEISSKKQFKKLIIDEKEWEEKSKENVQKKAKKKQKIRRL